MRLLLAADYLNELLHQGISLIHGLPRPAVVGLALAGGFLLYRALGNSRSAPLNRRC